MVKSAALITKTPNHHDKKKHQKRHTHTKTRKSQEVIITPRTQSILFPSSTHLFLLFLKGLRAPPLSLSFLIVCLFVYLFFEVFFCLFVFVCVSISSTQVNKWRAFLIPPRRGLPAALAHAPKIEMLMIVWTPCSCMVSRLHFVRT